MDKAILQKLLEERSVFGLLAYHGMQPVGAAMYHFYRLAAANGRNVMYLEDLYCDSSFRGNGVGTALMQALCAAAHQQNCVKIEWKCLTANPKAAAFYQKLGAKPDGIYQTFTLNASDFLIR